MCFCLLQLSLKNHNLDIQDQLGYWRLSCVPVCFSCFWRTKIWIFRTNLDTKGNHVLLCASGVSEEPQSGQDQPGYWRLSCVPVCFRCPWKVTIWTGPTWISTLRAFGELWPLVWRLSSYRCKVSFSLFTVVSTAFFFVHRTLYSTVYNVVRVLQFDRRTLIVNVKKYVVFYCREYECMLDYKWSTGFITQFDITAVMG